MVYGVLDIDPSQGVWYLTRSRKLLPQIYKEGAISPTKLLSSSHALPHMKNLQLPSATENDGQQCILTYFIPNPALRKETWMKNAVTVHAM